jgi:hypothetical protein
MSVGRVIYLPISVSYLSDFRMGEKKISIRFDEGIGTSWNIIFFLSYNIIVDNLYSIQK